LNYLENIAKKMSYEKIEKVTKPKRQGEIKIPDYSDYLHAFDESP